MSFIAASPECQYSSLHMYNTSTSGKSALGTILPCDLEIMYSSLIFKSHTKTTLCVLNNTVCALIITYGTSRPGSSEVPCNL